LGTLIGAIVGVFCHFGISMPKTGNMRFSRWMLLRGGLARPIAITIPAFLAAFWLARASAPEPVQLAFVPVAEIITAFILWRMNFTLAEREQMMVLAGRVFGHARTTTGA
jgi:hypothetical protein